MTANQNPYCFRALSHLPCLVRTFGLFSLVRIKITGVKPTLDHGPDQTDEIWSDKKGPDQTEHRFGSFLVWKHFCMVQTFYRKFWSRKNRRWESSRMKN